MGYCVDMDLGGVEIAPENRKAALEAINALGEAIGDNLYHYSWVRYPEDKKFKSLSAAFEEWRYSAKDHSTEEEIGKLEVVYFEGQKLGDDNILWGALAPFIKEDAEITCHGEDNGTWKWVFKNGKCKELNGKVIYE